MASLLGDCHGVGAPAGSVFSSTKGQDSAWRVSRGTDLCVGNVDSLGLSLMLPWPTWLRQLALQCLFAADNTVAQVLCIINAHSSTAKFALGAYVTNTALADIKLLMQGCCCKLQVLGAAASDGTYFLFIRLLSVTLPLLSDR